MPIPVITKDVFYVPADPYADPPAPERWSYTVSQDDTLVEIETYSSQMPNNFPMTEEVANLYADASVNYRKAVLQDAQNYQDYLDSLTGP